LNAGSHRISRWTKRIYAGFSAYMPACSSEVPGPVRGLQAPDAKPNRPANERLLGIAPHARTGRFQLAIIRSLRQQQPFWGSYACVADRSSE